MCTFTVIGETCARSYAMTLEDAFTAMADKILQGVECEIWQGMVCLAHWMRKEDVERLPEMYRRDYYSLLYR